MNKLFASSLLLVAACKTAAPVPDARVSAVMPAAPVHVATEARSWKYEGPVPTGLDETALDASVSPCDDFYQYACGGWMKATEIPSDRARFSRGFDTISDQNELTLRTLLQELAANPKGSQVPHAQALGDFWASCMDESKLEGADKELKAFLGKNAVKKSADVPRLVGKLHRVGIGVLLNFGSSQDLKQSSQVIGWLDQGGTGLPDRDYYLATEGKMKEVRDAYAAHVARVFELLGRKKEQAQAASDRVLALELRLAKASLDKVARREPRNLDHRLELEGLVKEAPGFDWATTLKQMGAGDVKAINVAHVPFVKELEALVKDASVTAESWNDYFTYHVVRSTSPALPKRFQEEAFKMAQVMGGAKEDQPRWKKCVDFADGALGEALAVAYVEKTFGADGKATTSDMVKALESAFEKNLSQLSWMDEETKKAAAEKLHKIANKIGYPEKWRSYDGLKIDRASFFKNVLASGEFEGARDLSKIGKPVDKAEWHMTPPTVNAYYNPGLNEIVFPAGILQPPFFNRAASVPVNFGAMGMIVGHEITHGFDDEGRQFDGDGNLRDWWTEASGKAFLERAACVKSQFDGYLAIEDIKLNGALTLGENVADLGGLKVSHAAMRAWVAAHPEVVAAGRYNADQQFFLGYAQSWCSKMRPEMARARAVTDPHASPYWRVNGPLSNLPVFREAFNCREGDKMVRHGADRCEVW
jgi:putative endopeptidase